MTPEERSQLIWNALSQVQQNEKSTLLFLTAHIHEAVAEERVKLSTAETVCLTWKRMSDCTEEFGDFPEACGEFIAEHDTACLKLIEVLGGMDAIRARAKAAA